MKRRSFFKGFLGLIGVGTSGFLLAKTVPQKGPWTTPEGWEKALRKVKYPKPEWTKKDLFRHWIDVSGFDMKDVDEIVTVEEGRIKRLKTGLNIWVHSEEFIDKKYKYYRVWELIESDKKTYLHYLGQGEKKTRKFLYG